MSWIHDELVRAGSQENAFSVFLAALPYRFYGIFTLFFVGAISISGRDFGPMFHEEVQCRRYGPPESLSVDLGNKAGNGFIAVLPVLFLVGGTFGWMWHTGSQALLAERGPDASPQFQVYEIIGASDAFMSMLYGSAGAFLLAIFLSIVTRAASIKTIALHAWSGVRPVMSASGILFMAWGLGSAMEATEASAHLSRVLETNAVLDTTSVDDVTSARWAESIERQGRSPPHWTHIGHY